MTKGEVIRKNNEELLKYVKEVLYNRCKVCAYWYDNDKSSCGWKCEEGREKYLEADENDFK